jgi:hypothetical protein
MAIESFRHFEGSTLHEGMGAAISFTASRQGDLTTLRDIKQKVFFLLTSKLIFKFRQYISTSIIKKKF